MAYSDFSLTEVSEKLTLSLINHRLFENLLPIQPSSWLSETLNLGLDFALKSGSEKARFVSIDSDLATTSMKLKKLLVVCKQF